jgi:hypothetical protein
MPELDCKVVVPANDETKRARPGPVCSTGSFLFSFSEIAFCRDQGVFINARLRRTPPLCGVFEHRVSLHCALLSQRGNRSVRDHHHIALTFLHQQQDELSQLFLKTVPILASEDGIVLEELPGSIVNLGSQYADFGRKVSTQIHVSSTARCLPACSFIPTKNG